MTGVLLSFSPAISGRIIATRVAATAMYLNVMVATPDTFVRSASPRFTNAYGHAFTNSVSRTFDDILLDSLAVHIKQENLVGEAHERAISSAIDAVIASVQLQIKMQPTAIIVSSEGFVTLQWKRNDTGLLLVFSGDQDVTCSFLEPGRRYGDWIAEFSLSAVPADVEAKLSAIQVV